MYEEGCTANNYAVGAENADGVDFGLQNWAGKSADGASENGDKKCSILQHFVCEPLKIGFKKSAAKRVEVAALRLRAIENLKYWFKKLI